MSAPNKRLIDKFRKGGWLAASPEVLQKWLEGMKGKASRRRSALAPVVQELKTLIEEDGDMYMGFNRMFEGATTGVTSYTEMLDLFNQVLGEAPYYGPIGPPFYMILSAAMNTEGGFTAFLAEKLNAQFKKMFDVWAVYLESPASRYVLTTESPGGWFSPEALAALSEDFNGLPFEQIFVCDPLADYYGFTSWDHFFIREFRDGIRATELPNDTTVINAACESVFYNLQENVNSMDLFWVKGEPYSLNHLLNNDEFAPQFQGGTVFQGFLEVTGYHRWHAPVAGTIAKIVTVPGTYFVQSPALIGEGDDPYIRSLSFITAITTRMLIFIQANNPSIGLMCFVAFGMTEVSTCEATVAVGQQVAKGDEIGMFHFGGSTHCIAFRPGVQIKWDGDYIDPELAPHVNVRAAIGVVTSKARK